MKKLSLLLVAFVSFASLSAQTTILDHEAAPTTTTFTYFGNCSLDATSTAVIANPDVSGVNTSANVGEFVRKGCALTFAGAYGNPVPTVPVDLTSDNKLRLKVWMDHAGTFNLKLESSGTGDNWLQTKTVSTPNTWVELEFDATLPSEEPPFTAAASHVYAQVVIFTDLGMPGGGTDLVTYFDDLVTDFSVPSPDPVIDFAVDMNNETSGFTTVNVFGTFNGFDATVDPLTDPDGDGIYTGSVSMPAGNYDYLFVTDVDQEVFTGIEECIPNNGTGFWNRNFFATGDETLPTVCYNSCYDCAAPVVNITFELGLNGAVADTSGVYLAGGGNFDNPGGPYLMTDPDGDDIYSITVQRLSGFSGYYTFANGNCPDYSCKENIAGQPCARPENFNDRFLDPVTSDVTIGTCLSFCAIDAACTPEPCDSSDPPSNVSSAAGASSVTLSWDPLWQSVACQINGGPIGGGAGNLNLLGFEQSSRTLGAGSLTAGATYVWKVRCACSIPPAPLDVTAFSVTDTFVAPILRAEMLNPELISLSPNPASTEVNVYINAQVDGNELFTITDVTGKTVGSWLAPVRFGMNEIKFEVDQLPNGLYLLNQEGQEVSSAKKFFVQH